MGCPDITTIEKTECIGNSLATINGNFNILKNELCNLPTGVSVQNNSVELGTDIEILNFTGGGINPIVSNNSVTINVPGSDVRRVICLEEPSTNSGGGRNNIFILEDGSVRVCGNNIFGELGVGQGGGTVFENRVYIPRIAAFSPPFELDEGAFKVYTHNACTYVITTKGRVYGAGFNNQGQLGQGNTRQFWPVFKFINVLGDTATPINPESNPVYGYAAAPTDPVIHLATGTGAIYSNLTIFALTESGRVYAWGQNNLGQAGILQTTTGNTITTPTRVETFTGNAAYVTSGGNDNSTTTYIVTNDGKLFVCGRNFEGQAGINNNTAGAANITSFREVDGLPFNYSVNYVRTGGTLQRLTTFVTLEDGTLWAAGWNASGAVAGTGTPTSGQLIIIKFNRVTGFSDSDYIEDVACHIDQGAISCWALIRDTTNNTPGYKLKCWGNNTSGQLGLGQDKIAASVAVTDNPNWPWLFDGAKVQQVVVGGEGTRKTTLVLDTKNRLWSSGYGQTGLLGNGETIDTPFFVRALFNPALGTPIKIATTNNDATQTFVVGVSGETTLSLPTTNFLCLLNTGKVLGWGCDSDAAGQLGVDPQPDPVFVPSLVQIIL